MRPYFTFVLISMAACPLARSQAAPAAGVGTADLQYAIRYSESGEFGDSLGTWHTIDTSGSLDYTNGRKRSPFSLNFTGGYSSTIAGPSYGTGAYERLLISQGLGFHKWSVTLSDDVGYRPQAPTTGFSGMPGTGEPIGSPNPPSSQSVLTVHTHALDNNASGEVQHTIGRGSAFRIDVQHSLLRFPDGDGLATDQFMTGAGPTFRLNARNSLSANYEFSRFSYSDYGTHFQTHTLTFGFERSWSRALHSKASVGPDFVEKSGSIPSSMGVAAQAALAYEMRRFSADVNYSRATSGGSGYLMGSRSEDVTASISRAFTQRFTFEMVGGYSHNSDLSTGQNIKGEFGSAQASWRIGRYVNAFASYTAMSQSSTADVPSNVLTELVQTVTFGFGYSRELKGSK